VSNQGSLTWLGHASFRLDTPHGTRIYIDPWLSDNPACPDTEHEPEHVDAVLVTHGHVDHVGSVMHLWERHRPPVVAPLEVRNWLEAQGLDEDMSLGPNRGGTVEVAGVRATYTDARHSSSSPDGTATGEPCGIVVRADGMPTIYFAGDTSVFGDMALIARLYRPDVAVLPIGGHFTMDPEQAALALELLGSPRCVPCHYATFPLFTGTPEQLRALAPAVRVDAPTPGEPLAL